MKKMYITDEVKEENVDLENDSNEIVEAEVIEQDSIESIPKYYNLVSGTPLCMSTNNTEKGVVETLAYLCKNEEDELIVLYTNYFVESDMEKDILESLPIHDKDNFLSTRLSCSMIIGDATRKNNVYFVDLEFSIDSPIKSNCNDFKLTAKKVDSEEKILFHVTAELFASMKFIDNYIMNTIVNNYELSLSVVNGANVPENNTELFLIDSIDSVLSMAQYEKKSTNLLIIFNAIHYIDKDEKELVSILAPFDVGLKFNKDKFRGVTTKNIEDDYMEEADQYTSSFIINCRFKNLDKEYMIIKAYNKNKTTKLFLLDKNIINSLSEKIGEY
jgi:hypothetical protein